MRFSPDRFFKAALLSTLFALPAFAQSGRGVVSGDGVVTVNKQPGIMRMRVQLLAKSSSLKKALDVLKDRITAARSQVVVLGAAKDSIKIGKPEISTGMSDVQKQMMAMMRQRMRKQIEKKKKAGPMPVTVTATLTAEWKLTARDVPGLLLAAHPLQNKIRAVDIAGVKEATKRSPQEQELFEELRDQFGRGGDDGPKPGEPSFEFVGKLTEAERDKALAEAFQKAKTRAARLAKAAGLQLGALKSLSSQSDNGESDPGDEYSPYARMMRMQGMMARRSKSDKAEAISTRPGLVTYRVQVSASFDVKAK